MISEDEMEKGEKELQELTDTMIERVEEIGVNKEKEVMEV